MPPLIMVIDDNPEVTQVLSLLFRSKGYAVKSSLGGEEALTAMETDCPDLIICDIMMPGMNGFDVFQRVRSHARWRTIPFVFLTALSDSQTRLSSTELGAEAFLTKPFNMQELLSVVAGLLRRAGELQSYTVSEMDSFKGQLLFMITHELNTPLSVIRMLTDSMRSGFNELTRVQISEYLELLARSTNELSSIVESMLLALQIDSGRAQALFDSWATPHLLRTVLDAVVAQALPKASERGVNILTAGLDQPLWVMAHEQQLVQIFSRILDNAIRFSPKGQAVSVSLEQKDGRAAVTITDCGPGMSLDEVQAAFDRLRQINRAQQEQQGVGLSLNLVRSLVEIHGGEITVASQPSTGSKFTIWLPIIPSPV